MRTGLAIVFAVLAGCNGNDGQSCGVGQCLLADGRCTYGSSSQACGLQNAYCQICLTGQTCQAGFCVDTSDLCSACTSGCCHNGSCLPGTSDSACGNNGQVCTSCTQHGLSCDVDQRTCGERCDGCVDADGTCGPGDSDAACGKSGGRCQDCTLDQRFCDGNTSSCATVTNTGTFDVVLVEAKVNLPLVFCDEADCDLFVEMKFSGQSPVKSRVISDNNAPRFDEVVFSGPVSKLVGPLKIKLLDEDPAYLPALVCESDTSVKQEGLPSDELLLTCVDHVNRQPGTITIQFKAH